MVGILVHGNNHFIVRGPLPDPTSAQALARHWSLIQIGAPVPTALARWSISSREFRENLAWAVVVPGDGEISPTVVEFRRLSPLSCRNVRDNAIHLRHLLNLPPGLRQTVKRLFTVR
jgi:hypothetical protein